MRLSQNSPLSDWPGVQGLTGYDKGNYISVLYLAWAYILSARWIELLGRFADHECHMVYNSEGMEGQFPQLDKQSMVEIDIGDDVCEEEVLWWRAILCSGDGWDATTKYKEYEEKEPDDAESDMEKQGSPKKRNVEKWDQRYRVAFLIGLHREVDGIRGSRLVFCTQSRSAPTYSPYLRSYSFGSFIRFN